MCKFYRVCSQPEHVWLLVSGCISIAGSNQAQMLIASSNGKLAAVITGSSWKMPLSPMDLAELALNDVAIDDKGMSDAACNVWHCMLQPQAGQHDAAWQSTTQMQQLQKRHQLPLRCIDIANTERL